MWPFVMSLLDDERPHTPTCKSWHQSCINALTRKRVDSKDYIGIVRMLQTVDMCRAVDNYVRTYIEPATVKSLRSQRFHTV